MLHAPARGPQKSLIDSLALTSLGLLAAAVILSIATRSLRWLAGFQACAGAVAVGLLLESQHRAEMRGHHEAMSEGRRRRRFAEFLLAFALTAFGVALTFRPFEIAPAILAATATGAAALVVLASAERRWASRRLRG